ncbi:MAG: helix-turn-helix transcriptional regulator [Deltaproteobacteria bacterium]|nr:helix-turn-helix transcriptional regulator [Candidatus Anaeroferrophillus wilburensis]MBN2887712.1 helix-turn-helix transcriptional regulator [Deltaproteobacteria bacterium]
MERKDLLTTREVAGYLKINEKKVYQLIQDGVIPCTGVVGKWLFSLEQINRWLEEKTALAKNILVAGSDDPLLMRLVEMFNRQFFPHHLVFHAAIGSQHGLMSLANGSAQVAGVHLFHPPTGDYNLPYVKKHCAGKRVVVVNLAYRQQGLLVAPGNPLRITGITDLIRPEVRFVNRNQGSGTRFHLDYLLHQEQLADAPVHGYQQELATHQEVAVQILKGAADVGMGIVYAAAEVGLDFIPLVEERFDLVAMAESYHAHPIADFFALLEPEKLTLKTGSFPGYDFRDAGTIVWQNNS